MGKYAMDMRELLYGAEAPHLGMLLVLRRHL